MIFRDICYPCFGRSHIGNNLLCSCDPVEYSRKHSTVGVNRSTKDYYIAFVHRIFKCVGFIYQAAQEGNVPVLGIIIDPDDPVGKFPLPQIQNERSADKAYSYYCYCHGLCFLEGPSQYFFLAASVIKLCFLYQDILQSFSWFH